MKTKTQLEDLQNTISTFANERFQNTANRQNLIVK